MASDREALQARLTRRFAWALELYESTMKMQGREWKGIRRSTTPEQLADFVIQFKTDAFRTFVRQATGAHNVRIEYYDVDVTAQSQTELDGLFRERTLAYDSESQEHIVRLPTAWLTNDYACVYRPLNTHLERMLVAVWQQHGAPDAPDV